MVVLIGLGQLGSVFAHGLLRRGHTVVPINRGDKPEEVARRVPEPELVLIAVGEGDLAPILEELPPAFRDAVGLVQNGLLPPDWEAHDLHPTVAVVWFEKKKNIVPTPILPTLIAGPQAELLVHALRAVELPAEVIDEAALPQALVLKNVYINVFNLAALAPDIDPAITVGALWRKHRTLTTALLGEAVALEAARLGQTIDRATIERGVERAVKADPNHRARGRRAPARLEQALRFAKEQGLSVPTIEALAP